MSKPLFSTIQNLPSDNTIFIIGSGIVALARYLGKSTRLKCLYAGVVGQFNDNPVATKLAVNSVGEYRTIPKGFKVDRGMELTYTESRVKELKKETVQQRADCKVTHLRRFSTEKAASLAPDFVKTDYISRAC
ncbi:hypothetical protein GX48_05861 [Paracoccidioides brasiliensis]|nr:hypothetical protein GX48_05861 [Paracoccidioides brasiliensis]